MDDKKRIVVVLGMHRSGTSVLSRALKVFDVEIGDNLMPPIPNNNEKGFWEDNDIYTFNESLLNKIDTIWHGIKQLDSDVLLNDSLDEEVEQAMQILDKKIADVSHFGFKDPRTAILLPFWQKVFENLDLDDSYIISLRNPISVAKSLEKRDGLKYQKSFLLWEKHVVCAINNTCNKPRIIVDYDLLIDSPLHQLRRIAKVLDLKSPDENQDELNDYIDNFITKKLRHNVSNLTQLKSSYSIPQFIYKTYKLLNDIAKDKKSLSDASFDRSWKSIIRRYNDLIPIYSYIDTLEIERSIITKNAMSIRNELSNPKLGNDKSQKENYNANNELRAQKNVALHAERNTLIKELDKQKEKEIIYANQNRKLNDETKLLRNELKEEKKNTGKLLKDYQKVATECDVLKDNLQKKTQEIEMLVSKNESLITEQEILLGEIEDTVKEKNNISEKLLESNVMHSTIENELNKIKKSNSYRLTAPLRSLRRLLISYPYLLFRRLLSNTARIIWYKSPLSTTAKRRLKNYLFTVSPGLFRNTEAYRAWNAFNNDNSGELSHNKKLESRVIPADNDDQILHEDNPVPVPLSQQAPLIDSPVKIISFYLPQFHPIPENDEWWGEGFTEWTNVKPALPQYNEHYQPHVPNELGYYDLRDRDIQRRQIELAKLYGVYGFCFYFYWFSGKRLLEKPLIQYLESTDLDLPYCICWANENWSRRWDGLDNEILIGQNHSPEDDLAFIEYVSKYLKDPRYIRVNGKPLLVVYRPSLLPSANKTAARWRKWCIENGVGEIHLAYTQSFESVNPKKYGFDAAIEFPPNNSNPPIITETIAGVKPEFSGVIYDYNIFEERSKNYQSPSYTLYRGVCPSWDNTARRKNSGAIFHGTTPQKYKNWLHNAVKDTFSRFSETSQRLIFVNAWNEWAEGAHLEPDQKYGYAYLQATRDAQEQAAIELQQRRIVLIAHDAYPHGAQYLILNMAKVLTESFNFTVEMIVLGEGPLIQEYSKYATVHELAGHDPQGVETVKLAQRLFEQGARSVIANTTVTGMIVPVLKSIGFTVISLIHELPQLITNYQLQEHVKNIAVTADKIVFAAEEVKKGFESFTKLDQSKVIIRPQGIYKKNSLQTVEQINNARETLRHRYNLPEEARIILGVGFADYRKGIDLFVDAGLKILERQNNVYFLWLGNFESEIEKKIKEMIQAANADEYFIFPGLDYDSDIYYAGADIYVLSSREDPFPSVVMEAMDVSIPVVAFKGSGGIPELLAKGGGVLVEEMSGNALSITISKLLEDSEKRINLGCEGKKLVEEEFSFRKYLFDLLVLVNAKIRKVSVVVPNYNYANYIFDRIDSIVKQRYPIYELIILDDVSSDNSVNVIKEILPTLNVDYKFIINKKNAGNPFAQWLKGVEIAAGDYIWIAEADDLANPEFLSEVMKPFDDSSVVLSYCQSKQMSSDGKILCDNYLDYVSDVKSRNWSHYYINDGIDEINDCLAIKNTIPNVSGVVFSRNELLTVLKNNIDEIKSFRVAGDWITYIHLLENGKIAFSPKSLNHHRRHESSVTISNFNESQLREIISVQRKVRKNYKPSKSVLFTAQEYSNYLYHEFGLATDEAPTIEKNQTLASNLVKTNLFHK